MSDASADRGEGSPGDRTGRDGPGWPGSGRGGPMGGHGPMGMGAPVEKAKDFKDAR